MWKYTMMNRHADGHITFAGEALECDYCGKIFMHEDTRGIGRYRRTYCSERCRVENKRQKDHARRSAIAASAR